MIRKILFGLTSNASVFGALLLLTSLAQAAPPAWVGLKSETCEGNPLNTPEPEFLGPAFGDAVHSPRDYCYYSLAKKSGRLGYCHAIAENALDRMCVRMMAVTKKDYKICFEFRKLGKDTLPKYYERDCLMTYALEHDDPKVCSIFLGGRPDDACTTALKNKPARNAKKNSAP